MRQILKNRKGVTLIELLAVIVILGIIAAIAVPTIGGLIDRQRANAAEATFDNIVEAAKLYATSESDTSFTLLDLETADYIDLKDQVTVTGTLADLGDVTITVSGNTVTIALVSPATALLIDGLTINLTTGEAS
jgi:type IV pilus assembly protein PilA